MPKGLVNEDGEREDAAFRRLIAERPDAVQEVALEVRRLVYDVLPRTVEVVWEQQGTVGWGTGPKKYTEHFSYFMAYARHVTLGFNRGGELADPAGLLPDDGRPGPTKPGGLSMRSVRLTSVDEVRRPELRALVDEATRHGVPPPRA